MTRKKEIEQAMKESVAETIYASGWGMTLQATDLLECAFTKGAEWADRNPKFSKQEFIEKACEWLDDNFMNLIWGKTRSVYAGGNFATVDEMIANFRKAMEE